MLNTAPSLFSCTGATRSQSAGAQAFLQRAWLALYQRCLQRCKLVHTVARVAPEEVLVLLLEGRQLDPIAVIGLADKQTFLAAIAQEAAQPFAKSSRARQSPLQQSGLPQ